MLKINIYTILIVLSSISISCKKSSFLDAKPDQGLVVPETISEYQALLDNMTIMNGDHGSLNPPGVNPVFGMIGSDDYYIVNNGFASVRPELKNLYVWNDDIYGIDFNQWDVAYRVVFYSNVVLDGLSKIIPNPNEISLYNNAKGSALFFRAEIFFELAQVFAPQFDSSRLTELGIVLRRKSDINEPLTRATIKETYDQIISDLNTAKDLLPNTPIDGLKNRPSKQAALGLLARVYLVMGDYTQALEYADQCLNINNSLIDYNDAAYVTLTGTAPSMKKYNPEVIFHTLLNNQAGIINTYFIRSRCRVDSAITSTYHDNDLRKKAFFRTESTGGKSFRGGYDGSLNVFGGIAIDEMYLIRAECYARKGMVENAMDDLNNLLTKRWDKAATYIPYTATNPSEALDIILLERRKELLFRGLRWSDIRRFNKMGANITLKRNVDGQIYELTPNSLQYAFLIPLDVISFNKNIKQNPR